jgi:hypothetical protein
MSRKRRCFLERYPFYDIIIYFRLLDISNTYFFKAVYKKMKLAHILVCFSIIYSCFSVVILQSTTATTIVSPIRASTLASTYYETSRKSAAGKEVQWITISKSASPTIYQNLFYSTCIGKANLTITAATSFNVYLNGALVGSGNNFSKIYNFSINIKCGNHNLTVVVYTTAKVNQGLTFSINQDQSKCYNCQANGYWNENACECSCITSGCQCSSPKVWKPYPFCGCGCPLIKPSLIFRPICLYPRYRS